MIGQILYIIQKREFRYGDEGLEGQHDHQKIQTVGLQVSYGIVL